LFGNYSPVEVNAVNPPKQPNTGGDVRTVYPDIISKRIGWLGNIAIVIAILCVAYGFYPRTPAGQEPSLWKQLILALWIVVPPGWFCFEYFLIYKKYGMPGSFETYKQGQDVAAKFWLAVSTVLSALYVGPHVIDRLSKHSGP
jgi:hypothetical protein